MFQEFKTYKNNLMFSAFLITTFIFPSIGNISTAEALGNYGCYDENRRTHITCLRQKLDSTSYGLTVPPLLLQKYSPSTVNWQLSSYCSGTSPATGLEYHSVLPGCGPTEIAPASPEKIHVFWSSQPVSSANVPSQGSSTVLAMKMLSVALPDPPAPYTEQVTLYWPACGQKVVS